MPTLRPDQPIKLRPYQQRDIVEIRGVYARRIKRVVYVLATGGGKTVIFSYIVRSAAERGKRVLILGHRQEIISQISAALSAFGVAHGIIAPGFARTNHAVQVASIASVGRRLGTIGEFDLIVIDEAHHSASRSWRVIIEAFPNVRVLAVTATPWRFDGRPLDMFEEMVVSSASTAALMRGGYLSRCRHYCSPASSLDLSGVRTRCGDYHRGDLRIAVGRSPIDRDGLVAYQRLAPDKPALAFATSIEHSRRIVAVFKAAGIPAEHVDGKSPATERNAAVARFERSETLVLSSVDLFSEGLDLPAVHAVLMFRPTKSLSLYRQMAGRALRPAAGKRHALIIDLVENWRRHGLVDDEREWSLDAPPAGGADHRDRLSVCPVCSLVAEQRAFCAECGAPRKPSRADDVALWRELVAEPGLATRLRSMRRADLLTWAHDERRLRIVALALGFRPGWAWHRQRERLSGALHEGGRHR